MILSLLSLGVVQTASIRESQSAIETAFKHILDDDFKFNNYASEKDFIDALSKSVAEDHMIVLATEPALFKAFKNFVCRSFQLKSKPNKSLMKYISERNPSISEANLLEHADIPVGATPLCTQDGLYTGFGIKAKKQLLIVLPLDDRHIDYVINRGLFTYVRNNMDMSALISDPLKDVTAEGSAVSSSHAAKSALYDVNAIRKTVDKLSDRGLTVAIANTKTVDFIGNISTTSVDLSETVFISPYNEPKGEKSARVYAIDLAKGALENSTNSVGAAITKVFSVMGEDEKPQFFMYICIADRQTANVSILVVENGETPPELIYKAIDELFKMLDLWADTGYAIPQFTDEAVVKESRAAEESDTFNKKIKIAVFSILASGTVVSLIVSFVAQNVYGVL